jgi:hypothetical protein
VCKSSDERESFAANESVDAWKQLEERGSAEQRESHEEME